MDHHCFSDLTQKLRSIPFASKKKACLQQHAQGPFSGKQAKEIVAMFTHSSDKVEALKAMEQGLLPMRSGEAASIMKSASFDGHKISMLEILIRYIVNLDSPTAQTDIISTLSFGSDKEKARKIITEFTGSGCHDHHHHHGDTILSDAGKLAIGAGLAVGGAIKGLFGAAGKLVAKDRAAPNPSYPSPAGSAYPGQAAGSAYPGSAYPGNPPAGSAYPGSSYPGNQPAGSAYPGSSYPGNQPAGSAYPGSSYPGNQPAGSAYPTSGYPGNQPAGSAYPGSSYPGTGQPAGSAYPGSGYPGTQPAGSAYPGSAYPTNPAGSLFPSAPPMSPSNPGFPSGSAYPSAGYPAGMAGYPGARPAGAAYPGYPQ